MSDENFFPSIICKNPMSLFFCGSEVWTQGLHLEPLHQSLFVMGFVKIGSRELFCPGWLETLILLISASWVVRITGMSHWCLTICLFIIPLYTSEIVLVFNRKSYTHIWFSCPNNGIWVVCFPGLLVAASVIIDPR
jgi:hypothetical protein